MSFLRAGNVVVFLLFSLPFSSFAAIQARTAMTIQGHAPTLQDIPENNLSFSVDGGTTFYSDALNNVPMVLSKDLRFDEFVTQSLNDESYYDSDGDVKLSTGSVESLPAIPTITWIDNAGRTVSPADYSKGIGCAGYEAPFKLMIVADNVTVKSEYGDSRVNNLGTLSKQYEINPSTGICSVKPNQLIVQPSQQWMGFDGSAWVWNSGVATVDGGGYSADFDPVAGFKTVPTVSSSTFPTTGFPKARFQLAMSGGSSFYTFSVLNASPAGSVTVDSAGTVVLESKPAGNVTIRAVSGSNIHDYTFKINLWAVPTGTSATYPNAVTLCGAESNLLTRAELTNSPAKTAPMNWPYAPNYMTRSIGEGLASEWGLLSSVYYPGSLWGAPTLWTSDLHKTNYWFFVFVADGRVSYATSGYNGGVVCRG
ncbi:hypothetical protein [Zophobihabitans entericus]|uniref:BIG2 domain-containing protein n=1 Tax=Zophobihabitans entericus TaxID=1635327 RepID=A0A6G9I989_9GAMM|nr:hypothetical protein [Zophobihabitans entericus]QIQ20788.1 hypothetical protein IPMB12_03265 [Zophobihabitans entericus]